MRLAVAISLVFGLDIVLAACGPLPSPTPEGRAGVEARERQLTFLPGAPKPGDIGYDDTACGGDHGMAEQWSDDMTGYPRIGPPQMSICP
jgi:hypothetical protein